MCSKESNLIQPGAAYLLPKTYDLIFDEKAGFETLQVIVAPERLAFLDAALKHPEGKLNSKQIAAVAEYWNDSTPNQAGISTGLSPDQKQPAVSPAFDKDQKKTTILSEDDSRSPTFDKKKRTPPNPQRKNGKQILSAPISMGIKLKNTGEQN